MSDLWHATWNAVQCVLFGDAGVGLVVKLAYWVQPRIRACDWTQAVSYGDVDDDLGAFSDSAAADLLGGREATLPTCPHCADLVDLALLIRAEAEQAKYDAERAAEKRGVA